MIESSDFRATRMPLSHRAGHIPVLGFGTRIPDAAATISATRDALEAGFRHFDCAERYRNEREVGEALQAGLAAGGIAREEIFVTSKLWNSNHRPDPLDQNGNIIYDRGVTLLETWGAMESLMDRGRCRAIGLSDISLNELLPIYESARIKPAVVQVEAHPYLPETDLLEFCKEKDVVFLAFAPLGQLTTPRTAARARENFNISALPEDALDEINRIQTRQRFNEVVKTGSPGFIPR